MELSSTQIDTRHPVWQDYLPLLETLSGPGFPGCEQLNHLLKPGLSSQQGHKIRFVASDLLDDQPYERRIFTSGRVSTRHACFHDFFNALVWARFPELKVAMNARHNSAWTEQQNGRRGAVRDALTLFDECGVIVFSDQYDLLEALSKRHWQGAFSYPQFQNAFRITTCGHAMLEKFLAPYKSMTAKALLIHVNESFLAFPRQEQLAKLDAWISRSLADDTMLQTPACLSPLPLAGIPGWWPHDEQSGADFYQNLNVFRPPAPDLVPAPVYRWPG